jgi:diadenosine tetraphosphate (Ap4A) HIT family hydrolase
LTRRRDTFSVKTGIAMDSKENPTTVWHLDPQLARDTFMVGELPLARVLAMNDANYPWLILVPRHPGAVEIIDLDGRQQEQLLYEITMLSQVLKDVTQCDKLNIAAIGNVVSQLHIHIVARRKGDAAWPKPVWGAAPARVYRAEERDAFIASIHNEVAFG